MKFRHFISNVAVFVAALLCFSSCSNADPWIGVVDPQLHNDLQILVEWGYIEASITTFPVPWKGIGKQLEGLDTINLPATAAAAATRLRHALLLTNRHKNQSFVRFNLATKESRFKGFDSFYHNKAKVTLSHLEQGQQWAGRATVNYESNGKIHVDNSYMRYQFENWSLRAGAIDQWWGPAQSSSLILSNNARPIPAIAISRNNAITSDGSVLKYLGPWHFTAQLGQLENDRAIPNAKIWMTRFTSRPIEGLEIGLSWTAVWGGDGVGNGFDDFWEVLTFRPECADGSSDCDESLNTKKGNHLAGFDLKYTFNILQRPVSVYIQRIGEDAADYYNITDQANLFGLSSYVWGTKVYIEASNTNVGCGSSESTVKNCYYEHSDYQSGYRFHGRAIGSSFDSDAKMITLGLNKHFANGSVLDLSLRRLNLNEDQQMPSPVVNGMSEKLIQLTGFYQTSYKGWLIKLGGQLERSVVDTKGADFNLTLQTQVDYSF